MGLGPVGPFGTLGPYSIFVSWTPLGPLGPLALKYLFSWTPLGPLGPLARTPSLTWAGPGPLAIAGNLRKKTTHFVGVPGPLKKEPRRNSLQKDVLNSSISLTATPFAAKKVFAFLRWGTRI